MSTTRTIFECFKILVTAKSSSLSASPSSQIVDKGQQFNESLVNGLATLETFLENQTAVEAISEEVRQSLKATISHPECIRDVRWQHTKCLLLLLESLHSHLLEEIKVFKKSQIASKDRRPGDIPPLAPDTLSIGHQQVLSTVLQFVVSLGVCTYLSRGVGIPFQLRSGFGNILSESSSLPKCTVYSRLYEVIHTLLTCVTVPSLGGFILTRHLGDLMSSLLQLLHEPRSEGEEGGNSNNAASVKTAENSIRSDTTGSETDMYASDKFETMSKAVDQMDRQKFCQQNLKRLLEKAYQPAVIRELLVLQGGPGGSKNTEKGRALSKNPLPRSPSWLRGVCAGLLIERIVQKQGVQCLLRSVLDISGDSSTGRTKSSSLDWQRCVAVANILTEYKPTSISEEEYFKAVCPQILQLLNYEDHLILQQVLRVCCTSIGALLVKKPQLAEKYLITPLQEPLLRTLEISELPDNTQGEVVTIATEGSLTKCVENLCKVYLEGSEPSSVLLETLYPVMLPLYQLYISTKESVWDYRPAVEKLLLLGLQSCDHAASVELVAFITEVKGHKKYPRMHQNIDFIEGSSGGVVAVCSVHKSYDERFTDSVFSGEQSAACCADLLLAGKGKLDGLAADFFILVLKELSFLLDEEDDDGKSRDDSRPEEELLLAVESRQLQQISHVQRSLRVLALVSSLCEGLGPTVLQSLEHMIMFAQATLERACKHLEREGRNLLGGFEAETVMFAFGLISAIIGGKTQKKVTTENRESLKAFLPLLERIASQHPSETLQQMAADLRIAIATQGAVWTENATEMLHKFGKIDKQIPKKSKKIIESRATQRVEELKSGDKIKVNEGNKVIQSTDTLDDFKEASLNEKEERGREGHRSSQGEHTESSHMEVKSRTEFKETDVKKRDMGHESVDKGRDQVESEKFDKAYEELFDPLVPVRGHALIALSRLLQERDPKALREQDQLLKLFLEHLSNDDSYVYLTAVGALVSLADKFASEVIPALCSEYSNQETEEKRSKVKRSVETRLKVGEALVKATRMMGEMAPFYSKLLLNVFLSGAKDGDEHIRASSLSNLGEICQLLRFSLAGSIHEIFLCLTTVLQADTEVTVRRACVLVLCLLLRGLGTDALEVLETEMGSLYRLLKLLRTKEKDEVMLLHVQLALEELDVIMKKYLFPPQSFSKKITFLP